MRLDNDDRSTKPILQFEHGLEAAPKHALAVKRHGFGIHHLRQTRVFHHFGVDTVALRARLVHDVRENHSLPGLKLDALRKRCLFARLHVIRYALDVLESAVVAPDLARGVRHAPVGCQVFLWDG